MGSPNEILKVNKSTMYLFELNTDKIEKDEVNIDTVYNESISQIFSAQQQDTLTEAGTDETVPIRSNSDKMEQIEHVIEKMNKVNENQEEEQQGDTQNTGSIEE